MRIINLLIIILTMVCLNSEIIIQEGFEGGNLPPGWTHEFVLGSTEWQFQSGGYQGHPPNAHSGNYNAFFYSNSNQITKLVTPLINLGTTSDGTLTFWHTQDDWAQGQDELKVYYRTSAGGDWNLLAFYMDNIDSWTQHTITLPDPSTTYYVAFEGETFYGYGICIDDVEISGDPVSYENDLAALVLEGPVIVNVGNTYIYNLSVVNSGTETQDNYTITLYKNGDSVIDTQVITTPIAMGEELVFGLVWNIPDDEPTTTVQLRGEVELEADENQFNDQSNIINVSVFPEGVFEITVGNGNGLNDKYPVSFTYKNSLTETMYYPNEMNNMVGLITGISYYNNFTVDLVGKPTRIWLGETTLANFANGYIPANELNPVFDGYVDYPIGPNQVHIELETPYFYQGGNLVVMVLKPWEETFYGSSQVQFYITTTGIADRTIYERDNFVEFDPQNPPDGFTTNVIPNTTFYLFSGDLGSASGYVRDLEDNPLMGAEVVVEGEFYTTLTDQNGFYQFNNIPEGNYDFTASYFGFSPQTINADVIADENTDIDFNLIPLATAAVYGDVVGSDHPEIGLEEALVSLTGFDNYSVYTDDDGYFIFPEVYTELTYHLDVVFEGYEPFSDDVAVTGSDFDLGTIILNEITFPPGNVYAVQNEVQNQVDITWSEPGVGDGEFRYDDDVFDFEIGWNNTPYNAIFGAVHRHHAIITEIHWYLSSTYANHSNVKLYLFGLDVYGEPDNSIILLNTGYVPNDDDEWNVYELPEPIEVFDGFLVGLGTPNTWTGIGLDDGVGEPWVFEMGTQYTIENYTSSQEEWIDLGTINPPTYSRNLMVRAYGIDLGEVERSSGKNAGNTIPAGSDHQNQGERTFESYSIYRFLEDDQNDPDNWDLIASGITETSYTDNTWGQLEPDFYQFAITAVYSNGVESIPAFSLVLHKTAPAGGGDDEIIPIFEGLGWNYPNPFNPSGAGSRGQVTTLNFSLAEPDRILLSIYNLKGQKIRDLYRGYIDKGSHQIDWDGKDASGGMVGSGLYISRLKTGSGIYERKLMVIR